MCMSNRYMELHHQAMDIADNALVGPPEAMPASMRTAALIEVHAFHLTPKSLPRTRGLICISAMSMLIDAKCYKSAIVFAKKARAMLTDGFAHELDDLEAEAQGRILLANKDT